MKTTFKTSEQETSPPLNEIGLLAWSLMAHTELNMVGGGVPGQPDPDTPFPQPSEPGEPTLPDEPPPAPVA
ncbi:hypothetical protein [Pseudomonas viridiflava]|uniref:hypothetical protein n=1 Tax=Pseudomonas viridiflava TaxID=33069 RepID=UPI000F0215CA|nr:hypothetical protein [Pseudomonas viridiflava]MBV1815103.1 hypothetical protein [Pseudomonas viridiflava]